jgi:hypothetical protein
MKMILAMIQNQATMFQTMMSAQKSEAPSLTDLLALIQASNKGKGGSEEGAVNMLLKGLELGKELGGGDASMLDVAREGLHALGPLLEQDRATKAAQHAQQPALLAPPSPGAATAAAPTAAAAQPQQGDSVGLVQQINWLRVQLKALVLQASRDKDPELYAEVLLDNLPDFITPEEIKARLSDPGAVEQLAQLDARVRQYPKWFEEFRAALVALLTDEPEEDAPGAPPGVPVDGGDAG